MALVVSKQTFEDGPERFPEPTITTGLSSIVTNRRIWADGYRQGETGRQRSRRYRFTFFV